MEKKRWELSIDKHALELSNFKNQDISVLVAKILLAKRQLFNKQISMASLDFDLNWYFAWNQGVCLVWQENFGPKDSKILLGSNKGFRSKKIGGIQKS